MSFSPYNPNDRYRARTARRTSSIITLIFFLFVIFAIGYWVGGLRSQQNIYILQEERRILSTENENLENSSTDLRAKAQTANVRLEQLKTEYEDILPDGEMRNLVDLVRKQIEQGVGVERLHSVILSARPPQNCSDPDSKRFVIKTPVYNGPSSLASISRVISIYGEGVSSKNSKGNNEAWFDPSKPVSLSFKANGQDVKIKEGLLPIHHSMVVRDKEYRFTITSGAKSFAKVTFDHCDYP